MSRGAALQGRVLAFSLVSAANAPGCEASCASRP